MADKYNYLRLVGKGSFGKAWLVESKSSQRQYVVKEIRVADMVDKDRHQAVNEVAILARLKHKNIVRYREAFVVAGCLNIVMAYADGGDLGQHIQQAKSSDTRFPETQVMGWFVQILFALSYIHQLKILHRDLKPQNIFLTKNDVIKLGDFGIARALKDSQDRANTAIGTPYYLSPEICRRQPYNHKSDMWTAGCVLYELLMLQHPFEADDFSLLVLKILRGKYPNISSNYGPLPSDLVSVLLRVNPERRPSADQIIGIQTMQRYVDEYTSRTSSRHSARPSESTTSSTIDANWDSGVKFAKDYDKEGGDVFLSPEDSAPVTKTPVVKQSDEVDRLQSGIGAVVKTKEPAATNKRKECNTANMSKVRSYNAKGHVSYHGERSKKAGYLVNSSNRYQRRTHSDSSMSQKHSKRKLKSASGKENDQVSSILPKTCEEHRVFCKEGITTVKRRKFSCQTPVAPKMVNLATPQSMKVKNVKVAIGPEYEGTPPALRLFGSHLQGKGIALRDGWSPDVSPRFKTRVLRKELRQEDIGAVKVRKVHPHKGGPVVDANVQSVAPAEKSNDIECNNAVRTGGNDQIVPPRHSRKDRIQKEVNEILLACAPVASETKTDIQAKLELLKMYLERRLGNRAAVLAYDIIAQGTAENKSADEIMAGVEAFLNPDNMVYAPLLIHIKCLEEWFISHEV